jgi:hypothetical protein
MVTPVRAIDPLDAWIAARPDDPRAIVSWVARCPLQPEPRAQEPQPQPRDEHKALREGLVNLQSQIRTLRAELVAQSKRAIGADVIERLMDDAGKLLAEVKNGLRLEIKMLRVEIADQRVDTIGKPKGLII